MRVTVCELPDEPYALASAWTGLREHAARHAPELLLLPEFAGVAPIWKHDCFHAAHWAAAEAQSDAWLNRLPELGATYVVASRPASVGGKRVNQGYLWSAAHGLVPLRAKFYLPDEPGGWEARWFERGDPTFPAFQAGKLSFGLNICTELWALETYAAYAAVPVQAILSPRATAAGSTDKWLSLGVVAAVRCGAFSLSSNRVDATGANGGVGWIINPDGDILATTSPTSPFVTLDIDLAESASARRSYPRYVFTMDREL